MLDHGDPPIESTGIMQAATSSQEWGPYLGPPASPQPPPPADQSKRTLDKGAEASMT